MSELKLIKLASHHAWQPVGRYAPAGGSGIPTGFHSEMSNPVGMPDTPPPGANHSLVHYLEACT